MQPAPSSRQLSEASRIAVRAPAAVTLAIAFATGLLPLAACTPTQKHAEATPPASTATPADAPFGHPAPLTGAARAAMIRAIEEHGDPDRADLRTPGTVTAYPHGEIPYDRILLVGSTLTEDRGRAFERLASELDAAGGEYATLESANGRPTRMLVVHDGQRYLISMLQW